jgi:hypothetical protein
MDNTGRANEEEVFNIIRSSSENRTEVLGDSHDDDGSQYLNDYGDGCEAEEELMFQDPEQQTMFGEVYTY